MNKTKQILTLTFVLMGCQAQEAWVDSNEVQTPETVKQREAWSSQDNPSLFSTNLELRYDALPLEGEAANIPWAGSYWPTYEDNINHRWAGDATDSPALKYEKAFGLTGVENAVSAAHGIDSVSGTCAQASDCDSFLGETCAKRAGQTAGRCVATWWGICHAWAPAAILFPEPKQPVVRNGVTFQVQDLKALASLVHNSTRTKFVSLRCNKHNQTPDGGGIALDAFGRPVDADRECRDTNAGTYHVLLANYLGLMKQSFVEDRTNSYEVWNQPLRNFRVTAQREVTAAEANQLIGVNDGSTTYRFNANATRFISVRADVKYISESSASDGYTAPNINLYTRTDRYEYVLELDAAGRILGGEWVGSSKLNHPDFLWLPLGASGTVAGGKIQYDAVKALVLESAGPGSGGGTGSSSVEFTDSVSIPRGEWRHFGPFPTAAGPITVTLTGTGDADLYVRMNGQPSLNLYDCRPYSGTSNEECTLSGPGPLSVSVNGYSAATVQLSVKYTGSAIADGGARPDAGGGGVRPDAGVDGGVRPDAGVDAGVRPDAGVDAGVRPDAGVDAGVRPDAGVDAGVRPDAGVDAGVRPDAGVDAGSPADAGVTHLVTSGAVNAGAWRVFTLPVTAGRPVVVRTTAPQDVDVYLRMGVAPTLGTYDAVALSTSGNETLAFTPTTSGTLYIGVYGYEASAFTLTTADR